MAQFLGPVLSAIGIGVNVMKMHQKMFPPTGTTYRVFVGLEDFTPKLSDYQIEGKNRIGLGDDYVPPEGEVLTNAVGTIDSFRLFNSERVLIAVSQSLTIDNEGKDQFGDITIDQDGNAQSMYTEIVAGDNAICIAAISATMEDDSKWGWTGDWGLWCDYGWFPSDYKIQLEEGGTYSPFCTWLDKDHTNGHKAAVLGIDWELLAPGDNPPSDLAGLRQQCGSSVKAWADDGGDELSAPQDSAKRSDIHHLGRSDDRLVISDLEKHSALDVCASRSSYGPDFISKREGVYCNMETREISPLCDGEKTTTDCFDLDGPDGPTMVRRNGKRSPRNPVQVINWG